MLNRMTHEIWGKKCKLLTINFFLCRSILEEWQGEAKRQNAFPCEIRASY